jgi:hypothetical protein
MISPIRLLLSQSHKISGGSSGSKVAANFRYLPPFNQLIIKPFRSIGGRVAAKIPKNIFFEGFIIQNMLSIILCIPIYHIIITHFLFTDKDIKEM